MCNDSAHDIMTASPQPSTINHQPFSNQPSHPRILTNMTFWQSETWTHSTTSIYQQGSSEGGLSPWCEALLLWRRARNFDAVVTLGDRTSLLYGLLCWFTGRASRQIMSEIFIDIPRLANPCWLLKRWLYRRIAHRCTGILTNCSAEIPAIASRFQIGTDKLRYVPLHTTIAEPRMSEHNEGYVLAAGRTLRDYTTLLQAAPSIPTPIVILCGRDDLVGTTLPANVTVIRDAPRTEYLDRLERCSVVVIPLLPAKRATGQVVLLEAMSLGKPVVATRAPGILDHIRNDENGVLTEPGNAEKLAEEVLKLINHRGRAQQLGMNALSNIKNAYTFDIHAEAKLEAITELWFAQRKAE